MDNLLEFLSTIQSTSKEVLGSSLVSADSPRQKMRVTAWVWLQVLLTMHTICLYSVNQLLVGLHLITKIIILKSWNKQRACKPCLQIKLKMYFSRRLLISKISKFQIRKTSWSSMTLQKKNLIELQSWMRHWDMLCHQRSERCKDNSITKSKIRLIKSIRKLKSPTWKKDNF